MIAAPRSLEQVWVKREAFLWQSPGVCPIKRETGWTRWRNRVSLGWPDYQTSQEQPLFAEWAASGTSFCRLFLQDGVLHQCTVSEVPETTGDATPMWRQIVDLAGSKASGGQSLRYNVYWQSHDDGRFERVFDAFAGFVPTAESGVR